MKATGIEERPTQHAAVTGLTPHITVKEVEEEMSFCEEAFGFEKGMMLSGLCGKVMYGEVRYRGSVILEMECEGASGDESKSPVDLKIVCPVNLCLYCSDVDELCYRAKQAGAVILSEPDDKFLGYRFAEVEDPNGYRWTLTTNNIDFELS